jgi:BioD-like phosphotransacetylase family protein
MLPVTVDGHGNNTFLTNYRLAYHLNNAKMTAISNPNNNHNDSLNVIMATDPFLQGVHRM